MRVTTGHIDIGPRRRSVERLLGQHRGSLAAAFLLGLASAIASLAQPLLLGDVLNLLGKGDPVWSSVGLLAVLLVLAGVFAAGQQLVVQRTAERIVHRLRADMSSRVLRADILALSSHRGGDLVARTSADTALLRTALTEGLSAAAGGVFLFIGAIVGMIFMSPALLVVAFLVIGSFTAVVFWLGRIVGQASADVQTSLGQFASDLLRAHGAIRTIRAANATGIEEVRVLASIDLARDAGFRVARAIAAISPISTLSVQASFVAIVGVGGFQVVTGSLSLSQLVSFLVFLLLMVVPLNQLFAAIAAFGQAKSAWARIDELLNIEQESGRSAVSPSYGSANSLDARRSNGVSVEFDGVTFSYGALSTLQLDARSRRSETLRNVTFEAAAGSRIAIVGPSGAGKSTLFGLLLRFMSPSSGAIRIGGSPIDTVPSEVLRSWIGYVEQDAPALDGTLRHNLTMGSLNVDDAECEFVLRNLGLGLLLDRSALGLDALVGDRGEELSGGERQRLAIARALLRKPRLLLLDESTSSLDGRSEQVAWDFIESIAEKSTVMVIAHRLSTVIDSDIIVVLDRGHVAAAGTHADLLTRSPLYRDLAANQLIS